MKIGLAAACVAVVTLAGCAFGGSATGSNFVASQARSHQPPPRIIYKLLHSFNAASTDGAYPEAGLLNLNGTLYGTASSGGRSGDGVIFRITTSGKEEIVYDDQLPT